MKDVGGSRPGTIPLPKGNEGNFDVRQNRRYRDGNSNRTTLEQKSEVLSVYLTDPNKNLSPVLP
jgi:hypothetical protein